MPQLTITGIVFFCKKPQIFTFRFLVPIRKSDWYSIGIVFETKY